MAGSFSVSIVGIVEYTKHGPICYDTSYKTVEEVSQSPYAISLVLEVTKGHSSIHQYLNFVLFQAKYHPALTSWDDIVSICETHVSDDTWDDLFIYTAVPKYQMYAEVKDDVRTEYRRVTPFESNIRDHIVPFSLDHANYVTGSYLNKKAPFIRNIKARIRTMPDLVFTKTNEGDISFQNTLVSVDGNFGYPEYSEATDELYIKNGAYFLRGTVGPDQNIVFLDFSDMIAPDTIMESYYFHECCPELLIDTKDGVELYHGDTPVVDTLLDRSINFWKDSDVTINFSIPVATIPSEQDYLPLVCFGGKLFMPGIDDVNHFVCQNNGKDYLHISLHLDIEELTRIVAANLQHAGIFVGKSSFYQVAVTYILSNIFTARAYNIPESSDEWRAIAYLCKADIPFVSVLTTDKQYAFMTTDPFMKLHDGELAFPTGSRGFLMNLQTKEILDYNRIVYADHDRIETEPRKALYLSQPGCMASSLNPGRMYATQMQSNAHIEDYFAPGTTFTFSEQDGNCWVARGADGIIIAKSDVTTSDVPYTDTSITWTIYETPLYIEDSMKQHAIMTERDIPLFKDNYNRIPFSRNIRDNQQSVLVDIIYTGKKSSLTEKLNPIDEESENPDIPVHTIEYQNIKNPVRIAKEV